MTELYLIRHGAYSSAEQDGRTLELGLSPEGQAQTERLRDRLVRTREIRPDVFISSPAQRAHETAQILAPTFEQPIILDPELEEWRSEDGSLTEEEFLKLRELSETQKTFHHLMDGYENWLEFSTRAQSALHRILQDHAGKTIVILTHGGVIQVSFEYFFGFGQAPWDRTSLRMAYASITHWVRLEGSKKWLLERFNDAAHLT